MYELIYLYCISICKRKQIHNDFVKKAALGFGYRPIHECLYDFPN